MDKRFEIRSGRIIHCTEYINPTHQTTVFLIHGLGGRSEQWREQIPSLVNNYNIIALDLYGHGLSDKPFLSSSNPYSFLNLLQDLQALFERYQTSSNIIIGHSYGGTLAAMLSYQNLKKIQQLILVSPMPCIVYKSLPLTYLLPNFILDWLQPLLTEQFVKLAFYDQTNRTLIAEEVQAAYNNKMFVIKETLKGMREITSVDIAQLTIPTLMILGKHDGIVSAQASSEFYQRIPNHKILTLDHAAHMSILEQPQKVNTSIHEFLNS